MTELADRLTRLADAAVADRPLIDPSLADQSTGLPSTSTSGSSGGRRRGPWLAAAAAVLVVVALAVVVAMGGEDDDSVTAGDGPTSTTAPTTTADVSVTTIPPDPPTLAIAFRLVDGDPPLGLEVRVRDAAGAVVAERASAEVEEPTSGGRVRVQRGLVVDLPGEGSYAVELAGATGSITCEVGTVLTGDRVVLPVASEGGPPSCLPAEAVEDWVSDSGEVGQGYLERPEAEVVAELQADGYASRVIGRDGVHLPVTRDVDPDRMDLMVFDGVVVFAALDGEPTAEGSRSAREPLAVVVVSTDGSVVSSGTATVRVGPDDVSIPWPTGVEGGTPTRGTLFPDLHPGAAVLTVSGPGRCTRDLDLVRSGLVVTVRLAADGTLPAGTCPASVESVADHVERMAEAFAGNPEVPAYEGLSEAEALGRARDEGLEVRILARDGLPFGAASDHRPDRINLVLYDDEVRAAALF